jgi:nucleoside transporter
MAVPTSTVSTLPPLGLSRRIVLSIAMFLQFAIWGSWIIVYTPFLKHHGFTDAQATSLTANVYLGAMVSMLFSGYIADRLMNSEVLMGICHLIGAGLLYAMSQLTDPGQYWILFGVTLCYSLFFNPTLALVNSLTFRNVPDAERDFPGLRVFGTIGWICAGFLIDFLFPAAEGSETSGTIATGGPLVQAAVISLTLSLFSFFVLPKTPPSGTTGGALDIFRAASMLKDFSYAVFFVITLIAAVAMGMYFTSAGAFLDNQVKVKSVGSTLAIGQIVELALLVLLPFFLKTYGIKLVMTVGLACWAIRYLLFAHGGSDSLPAALAIAGVALHGFCFDFFFASGFIHANKAAPEDLKASAQSLLGFLVYGLGTFLGTISCGYLGDWFSLGKDELGKSIGTNWFGFWMAPSVVLFVALFLFITLFHPKKDEQVEGA